MKHQPPKVEDYNSEDAARKPATIEKRKRGSRNYKQSQEQTPELEAQQPPSKAAKSEAPAEDGGAEEPEEPEESEDHVEDVQEDEDYGEGDEGDEEQEEEDERQGEEDDGDKEQEEDKGDQQNSTVDEPKAHKVIEEFGRAPLDRTPLAKETLTAAPETILAMAIDAMLKSRPISHDLSQRAVSHIIEVGYHDIRNLGKSSWEERTMVLKDGGYNRYREQGATNLGDLVDLVNRKYDGDLNNLLKKSGNNRDKARGLIKEIKGLGDLGADLFFNNVQSVWPSMAPFVDARSLQTAEQVGIGTNLDTIYAELDQDPLEMSKFANGLSMVRLEKKLGAIEA